MTLGPRGKARRDCCAMVKEIRSVPKPGYHRTVCGPQGPERLADLREMTPRMEVPASRRKCWSGIWEARRRRAAPDASVFPLRLYCSVPGACEVSSVRLWETLCSTGVTWIGWNSAGNRLFSEVGGDSLLCRRGSTPHLLCLLWHIESEIIFLSNGNRRDYEVWDKLQMQAK